MVDSLDMRMSPISVPEEEAMLPTRVDMIWSVWVSWTVEKHANGNMLEAKLAFTAKEHNTLFLMH